MGPVVSEAAVFGPLRMQLAERCEPESAPCPDPAASGSARPPSVRQLAAGPSDSGLQYQKQLFASTQTTFSELLAQTG